MQLFIILVLLQILLFLLLFITKKYLDEYIKKNFGKKFDDLLYLFIFLCILFNGLYIRILRYKIYMFYFKHNR